MKRPPSIVAPTVIERRWSTSAPNGSASQNAMSARAPGSNSGAVREPCSLDAARAVFERYVETGTTKAIRASRATKVREIADGVARKV